MAKARSPIVVRLVTGTTRADEDVDRRRHNITCITYHNYTVAVWLSAVVFGHIKRSYFAWRAVSNEMG